MLGTENLGIRVVIEEAERLSPCDEHGKLRLQEKPDDGGQRLRPELGRTERRVRPIVVAHQGAKLSAARKELQRMIDGLHAALSDRSYYKPRRWYKVGV